jgi:hypothetical protein
MPILEICVSDTVIVRDIFGEFFAAIRRWAENFFAQDQPVEEDEPEEAEDSPRSGTDPPTLGISVNEIIKTNDTFGKN